MSCRIFVIFNFLLKTFCLKKSFDFVRILVTCIPRLNQTRIYMLLANSADSFFSQPELNSAEINILYMNTYKYLYMKNCLPRSRSCKCFCSILVADISDSVQVYLTFHVEEVLIFNFYYQSILRNTLNIFFRKMN